MRYSQPDKDQPGYWVPENRYDAEELECRESQEEEEDEPITEQDWIDAEGDRLHDQMREDGEL